MSRFRERTYFRKMPDGTCQKETYLHDNLHIIMEDGILELASSKGRQDYDKTMAEICASLDLVLGDDETTKKHCRQILEEPEDAIVLYEVQMASKNQELRHFLCIHGYELGLKALRG